MTKTKLTKKDMEQLAFESDLETESKKYRKVQKRLTDVWLSVSKLLYGQVKRPK